MQLLLYRKLILKCQVKKGPMLQSKVALSIPDIKNDDNNNKTINMKVNIGILYQVVSPALEHFFPKHTIYLHQNPCNNWIPFLHIP